MSLQVLVPAATVHVSAVPVVPAGCMTVNVSLLPAAMLADRATNRFDAAPETGTTICPVVVAAFGVTDPRTVLYKVVPLQIEALLLLPQYSGEDGAGPVGPITPCAPVGPCGTVKLSTAAEVDPELVTEAEVPGAPVMVLPTLTVAAGPCAPVGPCGTVKLSTALTESPVLLTEAVLPGAPVVVVPMETVAGPVAPVAPIWAINCHSAISTLGGWLPVAPVTPVG